MTVTTEVVSTEELDGTVDFLGKRFTVAEKVGLMPLLRFAKAAKSGLDSSDMDGMAAMYDLLKQCITDDEWESFEAHADDERASDEDLLKLIQDVMAVMAERPTRRPSDSSTGSQTTTANSEDALYSRVIARQEQQGRPDLALIVSEAQEHRQAS